MKKLLSLILIGTILSTSCLTLSSCNSKTDTSASASESHIIKTKNDLKGAKIGVQMGTTGDIYATDYEKKRVCYRTL